MVEASRVFDLSEVNESKLNVKRWWWITREKDIENETKLDRWKGNVWFFIMDVCLLRWNKTCELMIF